MTVVWASGYSGNPGKVTLTSEYSGNPGKVTLPNTQVFPDDSDAAAYVLAVEAADGQTLEPAVRMAYNTFIKGCKADGIWDAIKESCILAGARTVAGTLVTLKGTPSPTNIGPFVSADYDRELGLQGDSISKALVSSRRIFDDSQDNCHISFFPTGVGSSNYLMGTQSINAVGSMHFIDDRERCRAQTPAGGSGAVIANALRGLSRSNSADYVSRNGGTSTTRIKTSQAPSQNWYYGIFGTATSTGTMVNYHDGRIFFYSIGESLDLALLDARVTQLMSDIGAAIP